MKCSSFLFGNKIQQLIDTRTQKIVTKIILRDIYHYSSVQTGWTTAKGCSVYAHHIVGKVKCILEGNDECDAYLWIYIDSGHYKYAWICHRILYKKWIDLFEVIKRENVTVAKDCYAFLDDTYSFMNTEYPGQWGIFEIQ